jgi:hypothetical protein
MSRYFRLTGRARDLQVLAFGNPKRIARRAKKRAVARSLRTVGFCEGLPSGLAVVRAAAARAWPQRF